MQNLPAEFWIFFLVLFCLIFLEQVEHGPHRSALLNGDYSDASPAYCLTRVVFHKHYFMDIYFGEEKDKYTVWNTVYKSEIHKLHLIAKNIEVTAVKN